MIDIKKLKIGNKVIAVNVNFSELILNKKYTISYIDVCDNSCNDRIRLIETGNKLYYDFRFDIDLNYIRKEKLNKISND